MSSTLWAVTLTLALGQAPCSTCNAGGGYNGGPYAGGYGVGGGYNGGGYAGGYGVGGGYNGGGYVIGGNYAGGYGGSGGYAGGFPPGGGQGAGPGSSVNISGGVGTQGFYTGSGGTYDPLYPYDYHETWVHGHFQEMPAYGGFKAYRPYNYKHVLSQSQVAAGWGLTPTMPYSHEYFRRMQPQASSNEQRYSHYQTIPQYQTIPTGPETARFRAAQREIPASPASLPRSVSTGEASQGYAELPSSSASIDPAVYVRQRNASGTATRAAPKTRVEELEETVKRQQLQIQAMQGNIPPEYRQAAAAALQKQQQQTGGIRR